MVISTGRGRYVARDGREVETPEGYISDLASTPSPLWSIIPPHGKLILGAFPHDWGCSHGGKDPAYPREFWNLLFYDILCLTPGIPAWKKSIAYQAVDKFMQGGWVNGWADFEPSKPPVWAALGAIHDRTAN